MRLSSCAETQTEALRSRSGEITATGRAGEAFRHPVDSRDNRTNAGPPVYFLRAPSLCQVFPTAPLRQVSLSRPQKIRSGIFRCRHSYFDCTLPWHYRRPPLGYTRHPLRKRERTRCRGGLSSFHPFPCPRCPATRVATGTASLDAGRPLARRPTACDGTCRPAAHLGRDRGREADLAKVCFALFASPFPHVAAKSGIDRVVFAAESQVVVDRGRQTPRERLFAVSYITTCLPMVASWLLQTSRKRLVFRSAFGLQRSSSRLAMRLQCLGDTLRETCDRATGYVS